MEKPLKVDQVSIVILWLSTMKFSHVRVCVCMCVCMYVYVSFWVCACVCSRIYMCVGTYVRVLCVRVYIYTCVCVCKCACLEKSDTWLICFVCGAILILWSYHDNRHMIIDLTFLSDRCKIGNFLFSFFIMFSIIPIHII